MEFPVHYSDISRWGIQRSNHETLSRVPPRSFGPMVNFLEKSKNHDFEPFQKPAKIRVSRVQRPSPDPVCPIWPKYLLDSKVPRGLMSQKILFVKIYDSGETGGSWIWRFGKFWRIWRFSTIINGARGGSTGRQIQFWARIRKEKVILCNLSPGYFFVKNA